MTAPTVQVTPSENGPSSSRPARRLSTQPLSTASKEDLLAEVALLQKELQRLQGNVDGAASLSASEPPSSPSRRPSSPSQETDPPSPTTPPANPERSPSPSQSSHHLDVTSSNPFFGGTSGRNRVVQGQISAQSGTGKVITSLQQDLASVRSVLESTRGQLRISQRAVEALTRTSEDLKDGKERLRLENEGLSKMVSRKERMLEETLERARKAESSLANLKEIHKRDTNDTKSKIKDMEARTEEAEGYRKKCDSEYQAMKASVKSVVGGWKLEIEQMKKQMQELEERHKKEIDETKLKHNTLAKMFKGRADEQSTLTHAVDSLKSSREDRKYRFSKAYKDAIAKLSEEAEANVKKSEESQAQVEEVHNELKRILRLIRAQDRNSDRS
ncbi:hypothetical protein BT69DRAFT_1256013 [Atractiella rhizophila]|nr:hypothetical protein BT69DRAFT_1256013 [Atractiella rhizophila]